MSTIQKITIKQLTSDFTTIMLARKVTEAYFSGNTKNNVILYRRGGSNIKSLDQLLDFSERMREVNPPANLTLIDLDRLEEMPKPIQSIYKTDALIKLI